LIIPFCNLDLRYSMKKQSSIPELTKAEEEIMQIIWELGNCMVRDILNKIGDPDMPHSTISSVVRILERKGFVDHKAYGKTYEYFPIISKEEYARADVKGVIQKYFSGSPQQLVSFLVQKNDIDLKDLNDLMKSLNNKSK
jgi:BlaI family transcriptional regulator, penicillinase repressor